MADDLEADVSAVSRIDAVPSILEVVCRTTGMRFAAIARVTEKRWMACAVHDEIAFDLKPGDELKIETTICNEIRASGQAVIIDSVADDATYCSHPTPAMYGFQSYISVPIFYPDGSFFGTLCALDPQSAKLNRPEIVKMFTLFADLIMFYLQAQEKIALTQAELQRERERVLMRERFVAVLGHDLRNPLSAIDISAELLKKESLSSQGMSRVKLIERSAHRMTALIEDVLNMVRVRLGAQPPLICRDTLSQADLEQVIQELQSAWPDREITTDFAIHPDIACDRSRISQLFSNLVGNALTHGADHSPIHVHAYCHDGMFEFSVANRGKPIPPSILATLFEPFSPRSPAGKGSGVGLGLYIASQVAQAHGGTLDVTTSTEETRFRFRMPIVRNSESQQSEGAQHGH